MTEYIVNIEDLEREYRKYTDQEPETVFGHRLREKVTRCGDCKYLRRRSSALNTMVCGRLGYINSVVVKPGGFCAWGERRDAE